MPACLRQSGPQRSQHETDSTRNFGALMTISKPLNVPSYLPLFSAKALLVTAALLASACSQNFTVAVNDQAIFDPTGRLFNGSLSDADLQGCVNIAMQQQNIQNAETLQVLSCANSAVNDLANIDQLTQLRFLDVSNNTVRDLAPLQRLRSLSSLNLANNTITDISPLLNMPNLATVNLTGNHEISCQQLQALGQRLGNNLTRPERCRS